MVESKKNQNELLENRSCHLTHVPELVSGDYVGLAMRIDDFIEIIHRFVRADVPQVMGGMPESTFRTNLAFASCAQCDDNARISTHKSQD